MGKTIVQTHYGCSGSCGGQVTEDQFKAGQKACGDRSCEKFGQPLEKMEYCSACNEYFTKDQASDHAECH